MDREETMFQAEETARAKVGGPNTCGACEEHQGPLGLGE